MTAIASERTRANQTLNVAQLFEDGYDNWGWVCWKCTGSKPFTIKQDGFSTRNAAYKAAKLHEKRRGHR